MTYEGAILTDGGEEAATDSRKWIQQVLDTREMVEKAGMEVKVVSVGGTHNYEVAGTMPGVTEVPAGSYALMDHRYSQHRREFKPAAKVMSTVTSRPEPAIALTDSGAKAIGGGPEPAVVEGMPGVKFRRTDAEHGHLTLEGDAQSRLDIGDKVWITPWDIGTCANLHDYISAVRDGKLEAVWDIAARGHYR